ncbi:MAG: hypothetical protein N4A44_03125 [Alphaproteobacteria bacterium]|jgi:hypothetical protein|nr:hypothetical protein [Alphaproteobacteria bacterium]
MTEERYSSENNSEGLNIPELILRNLLSDIKKENIDTPEFKGEMASIQRYVLVDVADQVDNAIVSKLKDIEKEEEADNTADEDDFKRRKYALANWIDDPSLKNEVIDVLDQRYYVGFWDNYDYSLAFLGNEDAPVFESVDDKLDRDIDNYVAPIRNTKIQEELLADIKNKSLDFIEENVEEFELDKLALILSVKDLFNASDRGHSILDKRIDDLWEEFSLEDSSLDDFKNLLRFTFNHLFDKDRKIDIINMLEQKFLDYMFKNIDKYFIEVKMRLSTLSEYTSDEFCLECDKYLKDFCIYSIIEDSISNGQETYMSRSSVNYKVLSVLWKFKVQKDKELLSFVDSNNPGEYEEVADILRNDFNEFAVNKIKGLYDSDKKEYLKLQECLLPYESGSAIYCVEGKLINTLILDDKVRTKETSDLFIDLAQRDNSLYAMIRTMEERVEEEEKINRKEIEDFNKENDIETKSYDMLYYYSGLDVIEGEDNFEEEFNQAEGENLMSGDKIAERAKGGNSIVE